MSHVAGADNSIADALSRFQVHRFRQLACNGIFGPPGPIYSEIFGPLLKYFIPLYKLVCKQLYTYNVAYILG